MMDSPAPATAVHRMVTSCRAGGYPALIARLPSGWVVMGERQVVPGYCLLLPDPVVDHLNALRSDRLAQFLGDMARVGGAVIASTDAVRVNYAIFGNLEPALHAHVFPRRADEPEATRTAHPFALDWKAAAAYSDALHGGLKRRIAEHIARISP